MLAISKSITNYFRNEEDSKCLHYFMAAMLVSLTWASTWRPHPKRYKFMLNILANNSSVE